MMYVYSASAILPLCLYHSTNTHFKVRGVVFPDPTLVLSASRDATVRIWKNLSQKPPKYDCTISVHGTSFINAIAFLPPSKTFPEGLIISGGKDSIIDVRQPGKPPEDNAEALLLGHAHNVCALDASVTDGFIVSGSWDGTGRVWAVGKWECDAVLEEHGGSVWAVLAFDSDTVITGERHATRLASGGWTDKEQAVPISLSGCSHARESC